MTLLTDHLDLADQAIAKAGGVLPATTARGAEVVRAIERRVLNVAQVEVTTYHVIHAGVYSRTICMPKGTVLTSALIKVPTTLTIAGECSVLIGDGEEARIKGYHVLAAAAGRIQAYIAHEDTWITMSFKTSARTVAEAEAEFTDEADRLLSRQGRNETIITED